MPVVGALLAWGYEAAYLHATGRSFLAVYQGRQLPSGALTGGSVSVQGAVYGGVVRWRVCSGTRFRGASLPGGSPGAA